jgi:hypothetical protein
MERDAGSDNSSADDYNVRRPWHAVLILSKRAARFSKPAAGAILYASVNAENNIQAFKGSL